MHTYAYFVIKYFFQVGKETIKYITSFLEMRKPRVSLNFLVQFIVIYLWSTRIRGYLLNPFVLTTHIQKITKYAVYLKFSFMFL